ncbi:MAG: PRC-barrel domain-containing protein [Eubacteriales bacterium]
MKQLSFDELREKEVINTEDCKRLGYITNMLLDIECGRVLSFTVRDCSCLLPGKGNEICVPWENISKIGDDIIFVNVCHAAPPPPPPKKKFFG